MENGKKTILTIVITVLATIIIVGVPFYFLFVRDVEKLEKENKSLKSVVLDNASPEPLTPKIELPSGPKLVKKSDSETELVLSFSNQYDVLTAWNNWLFVGDKNYGTKDKKAQVWAYNIKTDVKKKIFNFAELPESLKDEKGAEQYINNLQIFENKLWISLGGYLMPGYLYAINLDPEMIGAPIFVGTVANPSIEYSNGIYFVNGGEGDAGCYWKELNRLDINRMDLTKIFEINGCHGEDNDEILGNDDMYVYVSKFKFTPSVTYDEDGTGTYTPIDLRAVSIDSPAEIKSIFKKDSLPSAASGILVAKNANSIFIYEKKLLKYDLQSWKKVFAIDWPEKNKNVSLNSQFMDKKNILCADEYTDTSGKKLYRYIFDLATDKFNLIPETDRGTINDKCYSTDKIYDETIPGVINKLKDEGVLSSEFEYLDE